MPLEHRENELAAIGASMAPTAARASNITSRLHAGLGYSKQSYMLPLLPLTPCGACDGWLGVHAIRLELYVV